MAKRSFLKRKNERNRLVLYTYHDEIKEDVQIDIDELGIPGLELLIGLGRVRVRGGRVFLAVLDDEWEYVARDVRQWDFIVSTVIFDQALYRLWLHRHSLFHLENLAIWALQRHLLHRRHCQSFSHKHKKEREREIEGVRKRGKVVRYLYHQSLSCLVRTLRNFFLYRIGLVVNVWVGVKTRKKNKGITNKVKKKKKIPSLIYLNYEFFFWVQIFSFCN